MSENSSEIVLPSEQVEYLQKELSNIRSDFEDNKYILESRIVLKAGGLRSCIGCYWNAVVDDLRKKVIHRSIDLFNKEMNKNVKNYEDFQNEVTDYELIEGAYKIGILSWEGKKIMHQCRETRNIFDGHPDSSDPNLFKVFNMIADCNRYVLSQEYPISIINVDEYLSTMDTDNYNNHDLAIEQAFIDLPDVYKSEMVNKLFKYYTGNQISTRFRSNIEFSFPIFWRVLAKEARQQIGLTFDKKYLEGNTEFNEKGVELLKLVDGLRYITTTTRKLIYEPKLAELEKSLDEWDVEAKIIREFESLGSVIPDEYIDRFVTAITLTFVGYKGYSTHFSRSNFYSNDAAPRITKMFEKFDNKSVEAFVKTIKDNEKLKKRIKETDQLNRLRILGNVLLNKPEIKDDLKDFLEKLVNEEQTKEFYYLIN